MFARYHHALAGACLLLATPALAQDDPISTNVNAADLDLAGEAGRARLDRRIRHAAERVCYHGVRGAGALLESQRCYDDAVLAASRRADELAARKDTGIRLARNTR